MLIRGLLASLLVFAAFPGTTNYKLNSYTFGSGGVSNSGTSNYALEGSTGEFSGRTAGTSNYSLKPGFNETQQANVPKISSFDNNGGSYSNKLHFVIDQQNNPSDALYALSISADNFSSDIRYVKSDFSVGSTLTLADYQTYTAWGGAPGLTINGLTPNTTYYLKAKATQGKYTESAYGPVASATTAVAGTITFSVTTSSQPTPPFTINFGTLTAGTVVNSPQTVNVGLTTNAGHGADVYITGKNSGLFSSSTSYTIASASADLSIAAQGYGAQNSSITQTSGGPFTVVAPYNGASQNVGIVDTTTRSLYTSSTAITGGSATLLLKAKSSATSRVATDYADVLTLIAAANF